MNPLQRMQQLQQQQVLTKNDQKIYDTILADPGGIAYKSTTDLALLCGVSQPAITRFVKTIGYERYQDFRSELVAYLARLSENSGEAQKRQPYFTLLSATLDAAEQMLTASYMQELAKYVCSFDRLFVAGHVKSLYPAKLFSLLIRKLGLIATPLERHEAKVVSELMNENDLMIFFSVNGQPKIFDQILEQDGSLMIVTSSYDTKKLRPRDRIVKLPYMTQNAEESSISPVMFSIFVELLVTHMSQVC